MKAIATLLFILLCPLVTQAQIYQSASVYPLESLFGMSSGTAYSLTATSSPVVFSINSPNFTVPSTGSWILFSGATIDYVGATLVGARTVELKLRRTNNTAMDIPSAGTSTVLQVVTALTFTAGEFSIPSVKYNGIAGDMISMYGSISVVPSLGSIQVSNAWILGVRIA